MKKRIFVPYQICPLCKGTGQMVSNLATTVTNIKNCSVCEGKKVIPMFEVKSLDNSDIDTSFQNRLNSMNREDFYQFIK